jgi:hypothetical protein
MEIDKSLLCDDGGKPLTQGLFLELGYGEKSVFTLKEQHYTYKDKFYPSLKQLYLEEGDPTEYSFATKYLLNWKHWMRLCDNRIIRKHIDEWRDELEVKLRCQAVGDVIKSAKNGNYQAARWLADRGWETRGAGRPTKAEVEHEKKVQAAMNDEYKEDVVRLFK